MTNDSRLLAHVHPPDWRNPDPAPLYDVVVIGGGTAGLVSAAGAAGLGARVALVERALLGGDCLNTGCVPSKALLRAARVVHEARAGAAAGVSTTTHVDFAAVMAAVRSRRVDLAHHDSAARLASLGVHVFFGQAAFTSDRTVAVDGRSLRFRRAVIATGGRPRLPPIPGLADTPHFTSETIFELTGQPRRLAVIGGGPIGCEMAQAFALLGTEVWLLEAGPRLLPHDDPDAAAIIARRLGEDGVRVMTGITVREATRQDRGLSLALHDGQVDADAVLLAAGRAPNVEGLNLSSAGITHGAQGIDVDARLRTSNARVSAAGDVCSRLQFTHAADAMARIVIQNALFYGRRRAPDLVIPWATYTFPEVAHVGVTTEEATAQGATPITVRLADVDRAVIDGEVEGFLRIHHHAGRIVAATLVAPHAGDLIGQIAALMRRRGSLADLSADIFPYPTIADALRKAGDTYRRTRLTPRAQTTLRRYFALTRRF
jgi:pyruvate/2-oxoglutarate dehydrogenase complex dihydrolipoamide dehydrogenase (E3) component